MVVVVMARMGEVRPNCIFRLAGCGLPLLLLRKRGYLVNRPGFRGGQLV